MLTAVFVLVNLAGAAFQKQITYNGGKAWEGEFYYDVAQQYAAGHWRVASEAPLVYRVGTPFLASLLYRHVLPGDLFLCFKIVNLAANALTLALLVAWLRRFVADWRIRTALGLMFLLQWDTPTRWLYFYPAHTDPWMWVFLLGGLLAAERYRDRPTGRRLLLVAVLGAVGVAFREVVLVVPAAFVFVGSSWRGGTATIVNALRSFRWRLMIPLLAAVGALLAVRMFARQTNGYSFAATALHFLKDKSPLVYVLSFFLAFGPLLWLPLLFWRQAKEFLMHRQELAAYLAAFALLGFIGGTDTERLLYWSMPVVYVLIGRTLEAHRRTLLRSWWLPTLLAVSQLVASRAVFWPIPDYPANEPYRWPVFTPFGRHVAFMELFSFYEPRRMQVVSLAEYLVFGVLLLWVATRKSQKSPTPPAAPMPA